VSDQEDRIFTIAEARALLPTVLDHARELVVVRADLVELGASLNAGEESPLGGVPELKALEARLHEMLGWFGEQGLHVKGVAPLLLDFPGEVGEKPALLCWLEGESELSWWHRPAHGFAGRRRLASDA
jgi:hypothetical protein